MFLLFSLFSLVAEADYDDDDDESTHVRTSKLKPPEVGGRIAFDVAKYKDDVTKFGSGADLSYARISLSGDLSESWRYRLQYDFAGRGSIKNAYIGYYPKWWNYRVKIGNMLEPVSMDELTSSAYMTFIERALPNAFVPGYHLGITYQLLSVDMSLAVGVFGDSVNANPPGEGDQGYGVSGRLTFAPIRTDRSVLHFGMSSAWRVPDSLQTLRFSAHPESDITDVRLVDTGKINNVNYHNLAGVEVAAMYGPLILQSEYLYTNVIRQGVSDTLGFDGRYAQLSWLIGGVRSYRRSGIFGEVKPNGSEGVWELAVRRSFVNLSDNDIAGGGENNVTYGLNYYITPALRVMANYIRIDAKKDSQIETPKAYIMRLQARF